MRRDGVLAILLFMVNEAVGVEKSDGKAEGAR